MLRSSTLDLREPLLIWTHTGFVLKVRAVPTHLLAAPCVGYCLAANERPPTTTLPSLGATHLLHEGLEGAPINSLPSLKHILTLFHWIFLKMLIQLIRQRV